MEQVITNAFLFHNISFSSEGRLCSFQARSLIYRVVSLTLLGSEAKPEALGALSEVCLEFSPSNSEMERSTQELFLNFTVVLITVLLMWLLVRSYQY